MYRILCTLPAILTVEVGTRLHDHVQLYSMDGLSHKHRLIQTGSACLPQRYYVPMGVKPVDYYGIIV